MILSFLPFIAATLAALIACAALLKKRSLPVWCFFAGMIILGLDSTLNGLCLRAQDAVDALRWLTLGLIVKSLLPAGWLLFSLTYSRGEFRNSLARWKVP